MAISKEAKRQYDMEYRKRPEIMVKQRNANLKKFGITHIEYEQMLAKQGGRCAVCKSASPNTDRIKNFPVDHCHKTGKIRGLLCAKCNRAIGLLKDDVELLKSAMEYLIDNG